MASRVKQVEPHILAVISGYEFAALVSHSKLPTITNLVRRLPWLARLGIVVGIFWWSGGHFQVRR